MVRMFTRFNFSNLLKENRAAFSFRSKHALGVALLMSGSLFFNKAQAQVSVLSSAGATVPTSYTTLNAAFTAINAGTHQGSIAITITGNTTEPATPVPLLASGGTSSYTAIVIKPSGGNFTISSDAAPVASRAIIELAGADNVTIDGDDPATAGTQNLSIVAAPVTTSGVGCIRLSSNSTSGTDGATNDTIRNLIITGARNSATSTTTSYGIQFSNGTSTSSSTGSYNNSNILIQNNLITRCYYGIYAIGSSSSYLNTNIAIKNNVIGSATSANNIGYRGIYITYTGSSVGSTNGVVSGNDIRVGDYGTTGYYTTIAGIEVGTTNAGLKMDANNIHDISQPSSSGYGAQGIYISSGTNNSGIKITNNFIRDCKMYAYQSSVTSTYIPVGLFITSGATNLVVNHNTIVMNPQLVSTNTYSSACISVTTSSATFSQFLNNILVNNHASSAAYGFYTSSTSNFSGATVNNNDYYTPNGKVGYYSGADQTTLTAWKTATNLDALALNENPPFTSATDLHIPNSSSTLLESAGASVTTTGVNTDIDGQTRPGPSTYGFGTAPDIGADEFDGQVVYTCALPAPGATISTSNPICNGSTITLSMANATAGTGVTYSWESSANGTTYTPITGAVTPTYTSTPTASLYYRCKVTCANGPASTYSTPLLVAFANSVASATGNTRCGTGTTTLTASGNSGAILNWYNVPTGGGPLGSGSTFTTPVISSTSTFYVGAETISTGSSASIGNGTSLTPTYSYPTAFGDYWYQTWQQLVYTAAELQAAGLAAGNITAITFKTSAPSSSAPNLYSLRLGSTTNSTLSTFTTTGLTQVYSAATQPNVAGLTTLTFSTPYPWDGVSNIILDIRQTENYGSANAATYYTTTTGNTVLYAYTSSNNANFFTSNPTPTSTNTRINVIFAGNVVCSSPRVAAVATVTPAPTLSVTANSTICNNAITPLTITSTPSNYTSYVWSPATGLYTNAAGTTPYVAGSNAATVYLKSTNTAANTYTVNALNSSTLCAQITSDTIIILPSALTATAVPGTAYASGSTTLTLSPTANFGAGSFQWQSSSDNITFANVTTGGTSTTYTTPATTSTKYYRATLKDGAGNVCLNSVSDTLRIYNPLVTSTTPGGHCGPGVVTLGAVTADGTPKWYAASTGGSSLGSGNSFTTPSLTVTTTYYVQPESNVNVTGVVGTGGTTINGSGTSPFANYYEGARTQYLITPADLNAVGIYVGNLTSLSFNVSTKSSTFPYSSYTLSLGTTSTTSLSGFVTTTLTPVYGPATYTPVLGANTFTFSSPYAWDGVSNLVVDVCFSNDPGSTGTFWSSNDEVTATAKSYTATYGMYADNSALCGTTTGGSTATLNTLPVITFTEATYNGPRVPVVASINTIPTATVTPSTPTQVCAGSTATFTAGGGGTYQWLNANGPIAGATASTYTTGVGGAYSVIATTTATGCSDTSDVPVTLSINPLPVVNLGNDTVFCSGNSLVLNAGTGGNGGSYLWDNFSTGQTRTVNTTGTYTVRVTNSNNCVKIDTILVTVNPTPVVNLGPDTFLCLGSNYTLNAGNAGAAYLWDNNTTAQTRTISNTGTYSVKVTNSYSCVGRDTIVATYLSTPVVNLGADIDACMGDVVTLNAGNPGGTYVWDNGSTQQTRAVTASGHYYVTVANAGNCKSSDSIAVTVHALPVVDLGADTTICHGMTIVLNAANPGDTYLWNDNSTQQTLNVNATGTYFVYVKDAYHCVGTDAINVFVKPLPSGIINAVHGDTATYTFNVLNPQFITDMKWDFGDNTPIVSGSLVQHRYAQNGQYLVSVIFSGECSDSAVSSRTVEVYDVVGGGTTGVHQVSNSKDFALYPNPARDLLVIENLGGVNLKQVVIYNVLGQKIYDQPADNQLKHKINTAGMVSGIYTVRIETAAGTVIRKFEVLR